MADSTPASNRPRRRNRHGRGNRGTMLPPALHRRVSPSLRFSELLSRSMGRLAPEVVDRLQSVKVLSMNAPLAPEQLPRSDARAPLTGTFDEEAQSVLLYRWPIMALARRQRRPVEDVLADCLAFELSRLWGMRPEEVDPLFGLPRREG